MSDSDKNGDSIAEEIIEAFGGIRPMAGKLGVPVTTVQGWKKRQAIPETRFEQVLEAAVGNNVGLERAHYAYLGGGDIDDEEIEATLERIAEAVGEDADDDVDDDIDAEEDEDEDEEDEEEEAEIVHSVSAAPRSEERKSESSDTRQWQPPRHDERRHEAQAAKVKAEQQRVVKAWGFSVLALVLAVCAMALVLVGPSGVQDNVEEAQVLQQDIERLNDLHARLDQRLTSLESSNATLKARMQRLLENNPAAAGSDDSEIVTRLSKLEQDYAELQTLEEKVSPFLNKIGILSETTEGQDALDESMTNISDVVTNLQGRIDNLDAALEEARENDEELAKVLDNVSQDDLTAAAMLLALNQLRSSMNQEQDFEQDLEILRRLAGDDEELQAAIDRLAPHAKSGVLSKQGLTREFKDVAGEIVLAKMAGEDVSVKDKVLGRLGEIVTVRKEDAEADAQDTDAIVARAEKMLDAGDVNGAIAELEKLQGKPAEAAQPFLQQARGTAAADDVSTLMISAVAKRLANGKISGLEDLKRTLKGQIYGKIPNPRGGLNLNKTHPAPLLNDHQ